MISLSGMGLLRVAGGRRQRCPRAAGETPPAATLTPVYCFAVPLTVIVAATPGDVLLMR